MENNIIKASQLHANQRVWIFDVAVSLHVLYHVDLGSRPAGGTALSLHYICSEVDYPECLECLPHEEPPGGVEPVSGTQGDG